MIGGNPNDFLDNIYSGQDTVFIYKGITFWAQGYNNPAGGWHYEIVQYQPKEENILWSKDSNSIDECFNAFLDANIFDGRKFWDAENDVQWIDS